MEDPRDAGKTIANANYQTGTLLNGIQAIFVYATDHKGIIPGQVAVGEANGIDEVIATVDIALDRMHTALTVVLGTDLHAFLHELLPELKVVDDIAVMRSHHVAIRIQVRLGVDLRRLAEGSPAQLGNAARAAHLLNMILPGDGIHLTHILAQIDLAVAERGSAYGIVAAIGQPLGGADQGGTEHLFFTGNNAENTTHAANSYPGCGYDYMRAGRG